MKANTSPPPLDPAYTWIDRRAKLFEAGDYPDKGLTVDEDDLLKLQDTFGAPVPVLIEHADSPLQLGFLTGVEAQGHELFGMVALTKEANDLIEASGAHSLSLGLDAALSKIQEVSLVSRPRVPSARLFHGEVLSLEPDWQTRFRRLESDVARQSAETQVARLLKEGKLVPAQAEAALALLEGSQTVTFDGGPAPVSSVVLRLLESARAHTLFAPTAPESAPPTGIPDDERAFYERYFGGLSLEEIAKHRGA
ncbi:MAG: hypothetical protein JST30_16215 [Armatimonadetes bacterium]|nr:hypothetical protein [Armatimonadota bacterium]